jgi:hypothetical protein
MYLYHNGLDCPKHFPNMADAIFATPAPSTRQSGSCAVRPYEVSRDTGRTDIPNIEDSAEGFGAMDQALPQGE